MSRLLSWLLLCCTILTACQAPAPNNPLTSIPTLASVTPQFAVPSEAWQVWHAGPSPKAVLGLVTQADRLWVGTRFGVWQIDPATNRLLRHDEQLGEVGQLLPIENGQMWAVGSGGLFFFDGQQWRNIKLPDAIARYGGGGGIYTMAVDAAGDLWLVSGAWRGVSVYHYGCKSQIVISS